MRADLRKMTPEERLRHLQRTRVPWVVCAPGHARSIWTEHFNPMGPARPWDTWRFELRPCDDVISGAQYANAVYMHCHWHSAYPRDPHRCKWISPESIRPARPTLDELKRLLRDGPERPKRRAITRCVRV